MEALCYTFRMVIIVKRPLWEREIDAIVSDIRSYPSLIYVAKSRLAQYKTPYVLEENGVFVGLCAVYEFDQWVKLGPLVFLQQFHGKGYGNILLTQIVADYAKKDIYVTSSNIAVQKIIEKLHFTEVKGVWRLPLPVKIFLLKQLYEHMHWDMITEFIRKKLTMKSSARKYYIRQVV